MGKRLTSRSQGAEDLVTAYEELNGSEPGLYSFESYDATNIFLECISEGATERADIEECVDGIEYEGVTKTFKFKPDGELDGEVTIYAYKVTGGKIEGLAPIG